MRLFLEDAFYIFDKFDNFLDYLYKLDDAIDLADKWLDRDIEEIEKYQAEEKRLQTQLESAKTEEEREKIKEELLAVEREMEMYRDDYGDLRYGYVIMDRDRQERYSNGNY